MDIQKLTSVFVIIRLFIIYVEIILFSLKRNLTS